MSPFNIGRRILVTDFTPEEAKPLAQGMLGGQAVLDRVLYWTSGHPYMTQRLCRAVSEMTADDGPRTTGKLVGGPSSVVDFLCESLFLTKAFQESDDNLAFVRNRLLRSEADLASLLDLYTRVRSGKPVKDDETAPLVPVLRLSGVVRVENGLLKVRNRIYDHVFDRNWVTAHMPDAELRRQRAAYRRGVVRTAVVAGAVILGMAAVSATAIRARNGEARAKKDALKEAARATAGEKKAKEEAERANNLVYAADMNLAQQAYEAGDVVRVEQLLKETESGADRGWEWNYLNRAVHTERLAIKAGDDYVEAKFTGDGKRIVTVEQTYEDVRCSW